MSECTEALFFLCSLYYYGLRLTNKHLFGALDPYTTNTAIEGSFGAFYHA
jgi:hypothetical protein